MSSTSTTTLARAAPVFALSTPLQIRGTGHPQGPPQLIRRYQTCNSISDLESLGSKKIVLAGYMAYVCMSTTDRDAAGLGYDVIVAEVTVGDRSIPGVGAEQLVRVVLSEIRDAFITLVKSRDIN